LLADGGGEPFGDLPDLHDAPSKPVEALVPTSTDLGYSLIGSAGGVANSGSCDGVVGS